MTTIHYDRPTRRETATLVRRRPIMIECHPRLCVLRLKGLRYRYEVPWEAIWWTGAEIAARARAEEKRRKRQQRRTK